MVEETERRGQLPAILLPVLVVSRGREGFSTTADLEGSCARVAQATLTSGISDWVNCPEAKRAGANLVFTSHQLKCFYFWRELASHNHY